MRNIGHVLIALALASGCTGRIGDAPGLDTQTNPGTSPPPPPPPGPVDACGPPGAEAGYVPVMRLTASQYENVVDDLFLGLVHAGPQFPESKELDGYSTDPAANVVSLVDAESIMLAAEEAGTQIAERVALMLACAPDSDRACAETFVDEYGARAFRRPLREDERTLLLALYDDVAGELTFEESIAVLTTTMLQMPQFLYILEVGEAVDGMEDVVALDGYELATRLAMTFWGTLPDATLIELAEAGELKKASVVEAQARRLLSNERALSVMHEFHREWMGVGELKVGDKDPSLFPELDQELARSIDAEFDAFIDYVLRYEGGSLPALLTSNQTFVNRTMARFYGLDPTVSAGPDDWVPVSLDTAQRSGVLSRPAVMAEHAHQIQTSPVFRGKLVRTRLLCANLPPPPPDAMSLTPDFPEEATQREKSEILIETRSCGGCHTLMNPIGLGLENYDALGRWQTEEADGRPIDVSGRVINGQGLTEFVGPEDLANQLADFDVVHRCMVQQWFRYSFGRKDERSDGCSVDRAAERFVASGLDVRELLVGLAVTDAFRYRRLPEGEGVP